MQFCLKKFFFFGFMFFFLFCFVNETNALQQTKESVQNEDGGLEMYTKDNIEFYIFIGIFVLFLPLTQNLTNLILNLTLVIVTDVLLSFAVVDYFFKQKHLHKDRVLTFYLFLAMMTAVIFVSFIAAISDLYTYKQAQINKKKIF